MDSNRSDQSVPEDTSEVQLRDDEVSHIRGVQTALKEEYKEPEDVRPSADVIPLFRSKTAMKVRVALFDDLELERIRKNGTAVQKFQEIWGKLGLPQELAQGSSVSQMKQACEPLITSLIQQMRPGLDSWGERTFNDISTHAQSFLQKFPLGTQQFNDGVRDLYKLYYLLQAFERVAARSGY